MIQLEIKSNTELRNFIAEMMKENESTGGMTRKIIEVFGVSEDAPTVHAIKDKAVEEIKDEQYYINEVKRLSSALTGVLRAANIKYGLCFEVECGNLGALSINLGALSNGTIDALYSLRVNKCVQRREVKI